ncbi:MAG: NADH-quinone oxidoreductase subunit L [Candidatus Omnitrophica bacterium]|nr:NADH-quinone oxidoreductase subunit L [Candidatus Omnitrophota bacterium]MBI3083659.1 NADH-quinone oxidoreductase subunit L [Candidatus Omnitrophota bacterium]
MPLAPLVSWTILLAPLGAALLIQVVGIHRRRLSATLAIGALLTSFVCTGWVFLQALHNPAVLPFELSISWISLPGLTVPFGILMDRLSLLMTLVVTGVGSAIFIYSIGYMADDHAYSRFFGVLSLFAFSMLTIVLSNNWIELFIGWELVGCCSYLLIGHWYARPSAAEAGKKAFLVNRVADFGFFIGILALWAISSPLASERTFHFQALQERLPGLAHQGLIPLAMLPLIGLLLFCGPLGKSAQFPLHVWLPDAMEGPTPVSALIHAATMVAAGVYLLCRAFWLFEHLPSVMTTIMWVGASTAFLSACLAFVENDLKRILAYSTLSQLGYMVMALGLGGPVAGMYHLTTHAFFKALLFLAAGSVIHGTHEQDIWKLGGLLRPMPWTSGAFLIGGLALCGFPGLSGFFSKDEILVLAHERNLALYWLGTLTAGMTAFYIARAWFVAFTGKARGHPHESPPVMIGPLVLLAALSIVGGYLGIPRFLGEHGGAFHWAVAGMSLAVVAAGLVLAWLIYGKQAISAQQLVHALALPYSFLQRRYYIDEIYAWYVAVIQQKLIAGLCAWVERHVIIGLAVNGTARLTQDMGRLIRLCQTGRIQTYALAFLIGIVWLLSIPIRH